jgi:hypothetical protein
MDYDDEYKCIPRGNHPMLGGFQVAYRTGHTVTVGIKSVKEKAYLQGQHLSVIASRKPVIEIDLPANDTIDDYIVVEMDGKGDRREIEMGSIGVRIPVISIRDSG